MIDLQNEVKATADLEAFKKDLPEFSKQIETLEWEIVSLKSNSNLTYHDLGSFETKLVKINVELEKINEPIMFHIQHLEQLYKDWLGKEKQMQVLIKQIMAAPASNAPFQLSIL